MAASADVVTHKQCVETHEREKTARRWAVAQILVVLLAVFALMGSVVAWGFTETGARISRLEQRLDNQLTQIIDLLKERN